MKTEFKPIAMRCTEEQFNELKPRLEKIGEIGALIGSFKKYNYLSNNYNEKLYFDFICNGWDKEHEYISVFNADLFLQCCGVELEETFTLTKSEIIENKDKTLKEMFKGIFEVELEVGKWYKHKGLEYIFCFNGCYEDCSQYGITKNGWCNEISSDKKHLHNFIPATEEEVKTALENEAIKRGFKEGVYFKNIANTDLGTVYKLNKPSFRFGYSTSKNSLDCENSKGLIFIDGKWATIIKQKEMTVAEIEKKYNIKIIK